MQSMADYTSICPKSWNSIGQDKSLFASSTLDFISSLQNDMFAIIFKYPCHKIWLCRDWWLSLHANSGCSAVGSAHVWGARGRQFESGHPDNSVKRKANGFPFFVWIESKKVVVLGLFKHKIWAIVTRNQRFLCKFAVYGARILHETVPAIGWEWTTKCQA